MNAESVAGRSYPRVYRVQGRKDIHEAIQSALEESGGRVIYASDPNRAPFYFGVQTVSNERLGLLVYPFRATKRDTENRPIDEIRGQIRLGGESSWEGEHPIAIDVAGVDTTLVLAVDVENQVFIGLDPQLWSPLPLGISVYAKEAEIDAMGTEGWSVWEKDNRAGKKRKNARSDTGLETLVAFRPHRLLDYARFERGATDLGLDTPLRFSAASKAKKPAPGIESPKSHSLETQFDLTSQQILEIIATRTRLAVAVRGGVAEFHLEQGLLSDPEVAKAHRLDIDSTHDFDVTMQDGRFLRVECKNASPHRYADGAFRVEVQKTRASKSDPASRFYPVDGFDVVAACLYSPTGEWVFRFARTTDLARHGEYPERLAPMQRVDESWAKSLSELH